MAFTRPDNNKSIWRTKPDVIQGKSSDVKADFDKLLNENTDDLITLIDELEAAIGNVDNTSDADKPISTATQTALDLKVDKVTGKGLSTNDYDNTEKAAVASNTAARHSHANKALLDTYDQTNVNIAAAISAIHSHANKALLDTYSQTEANLADAVSKKHNHANQAVLDGISSGDISAWDEKQDALTADTDYLTPSTAASTYQPKMGADDNYVTDAQLVVIGNTSGTNTGDQDLSGLALKSNVLEKNNATAFTPTADYHPSTKKYVDDSVSSAGGGDMLKATYDPGNKSADTFSMTNMVEGATNKIFTSTERTKLNGIADGANNYTHPATHSADIITDGSTNKAYTATEKTKLAGIEASANNYTHPATHSADIITDGTTNKAYTATEKTKLAGIATGAEVNVQSDWNAVSGDALILNKPTIPTSLSQLSDDSTHRIVTDTEKSTWNGKQDAIGYTPANDSAVVKLTGDQTIAGVKTFSNNISAANLSNTNTGDETTATIKTKLGISTLSGSNTGDETATTIKTKLGISTLSGSNTGDQTLPAKATGAEADTGTNDDKFLTPKAAKDSHNIPSVAPGASGNILKSNGTDWESAVAGFLPLSGGTMTGVLTAQSNTSYTTKQVRNIILSTEDANVALMADGDIWIKYE